MLVNTSLSTRRFKNDYRPHRQQDVESEECKAATISQVARFDFEVEKVERNGRLYRRTMS